MNHPRSPQAGSNVSSFPVVPGCLRPPRSCLLWHPGTTGSGGRFPALALVPVMETYWRPRPQVRSVAQLGSAPGLGPGGRGFKSRHSDHVTLGHKAEATGLSPV